MQAKDASEVENGDFEDELERETEESTLEESISGESDAPNVEENDNDEFPEKLRKKEMLLNPKNKLNG